MTRLEKKPLRDLRVAVPETRQQDILLRMLANRGAQVLPVPLVAIHDHPDQAALVDWLERFLASPPDLFILMTGEGLRRLLALSERAGRRDAFVAALQKSGTLCRGPKPERVLGELGLEPRWRAVQPTTAGVITTLETLPLKGLRVCLQLYGDEPNLPLVDYLASRAAVVEQVAPYVYASGEDESRVLDFIAALRQGEVDVVAFTSQGQYKRLEAVARRHGCTADLREGLQRSILAAVGPVVREQLEAAGHAVAIMPERVYFMLPLVAAIERYYIRPSLEPVQT